MAKALKHEQLETAFRHGNFKPLYFLYGEERFLADELQQLAVEHALEPSERDFNLDIVYGAEAEAPAVLALCGGYPMMAQRRVVLVRDFDKLKQNRLFKSYAEQPNPTAVVLLVCSSKPNLSAHPYRALRQHAVSCELKSLYDNQMPGWIQRRVQRLGYQIEAAAVQMLADYIGTNLQAAVTELDKLITYTGGRATITQADVALASGQTRDFNVFELQKAIGEGRRHDALRIAERLLKQASNSRGEALMIVSMLTRYITKLWKLSACQAERMPEAAMAQRIGVPPFFLKEYLFSLRRYGPAELERAFGALLAADAELKGASRQDELTVLTLLLRRLVVPDAARRAA